MTNTTRTLLFAGALFLSAAVGTAADRSTDTLPGYLETWKLDRAARGVIEEPSAWNDAKLQFALRLITRLGLAPADAFAAWSTAAVTESPLSAEALADRFVRIEGRAVFIAPLTLPETIAEIADRKTIDVVRIKTAAGPLVDVLAAAAPEAWPRWRTIDEAASVVGLPLTTGPGPQPAAPPSSPPPPPSLCCRCCSHSSSLNSADP